MFRFGRKSQAVRSTLCPELQELVDFVIQVYDVSLIEGHRTQATQDRYFNTGASKVKWPNSKHNHTPSLAVDAWPYIRTLAGKRVNTALNGHPDQIKKLAKVTGFSEQRIWELTLQEFATMKGIMLAGAKTLGITLRFCDDWDGDGDRLDQTFNDLPHVEILR